METAATIAKVVLEVGLTEKHGRSPTDVLTPKIGTYIKEAMYIVLEKWQRPTPFLQAVLESTLKAKLKRNTRVDELLSPKLAEEIFEAAEAVDEGIIS